MCKFREKISTFGVDFDYYIYMSIDFVLNTQIDNIGQSQPPKLILFSSNFAYCYLNKDENKLHLCPEDMVL